MNINGQMMSKYSTDRYNLNDRKLVSILDDLTLWSAPFGLMLLDKVDYRKNINVLDIGSGLGFPLVELSQRLGNTCRVYGIDPWNEGIERINQKLDVWNITNVEMVEGFAEELPFDDDFFDLIISNNGINNVRDDKKVFSEINRVSKKNAQLIITVNLPETMHEFYSVYKEILQDLGKEEEIEKVKEHITLKRKPIEYTEQLIEEAGFKVREVIKEEFSFKYADCTSMFNHYSIRLMFFDSWVKILNKNDIDLVFSEIEKRLNDSASKSNGLKLSIPYVCIDAVKQ